MGTLREDLEAIASAGSGDDTGGTDAGVDVGQDAGVEVEAAPVQSVADAGEGGGQDGTPPSAPAEGRVRDKTTGKFTKATASTTKTAQEITAVPSTTSTVPPSAGGDSSKTEPPKQGEPDTTRPPSSWRHEAREAWAKAPPEIQREVARREMEMAQAVSKFHPVREFASEMQRVLSPIAESARARGTTPTRLVSDYVAFDSELASRDPERQARAVAQVIKAYGVDIEALAGAIDSPARQRPVNEAQLRAQIRQEEAARFQAEQGQQQLSMHVRQVQEFSRRPDADLMNDEVRFIMADLVDSAQARGVALTLEDAYNQAVWANPKTRAIVQQRETAKQRSTADAATQRSMAAGGSIKSRPASPIGGGGGRTLREDLEETAASMSGRT